MPCKHSFVQDSVDDYELCSICGSYRSLTAEDPKQIYTSEYWSGDRHHSTIDDQVHNVDVHKEHGISKNDFVINCIWTQDRSRALEIGCSPGVLLKRLSEQCGFDDVHGIEATDGYKNDIRKHSGEKPKLLFGFFPDDFKDITPSRYSLVLALDVFEHSHDPHGFLSACHRILKPDGQLLLMFPMAVWNVDKSWRFFHPKEHAWIHSMRHMEILLEDAGFVFPRFSSWTIGHDVVTARKK